MIFILSLCLLFTCTGILPISAIAVLMLPIVPIVLYYSNNMVIKKYVFWLLLFFFVSILSVIFYHYESLLDFDFYRRDGNFIVSFSPILISFWYSRKFNIEAVFIFALKFFTLINLLIISFDVVSGGVQSILRLGEGKTINFLFDANNAAGGWQSIVIALAFAYWIRERTVTSFLILGFNFFVELLLVSRGSILGVITFMLLYYVSRGDFKKYSKWLFIVLIGFVAITIVCLFIGYPVYIHNFESFQFANFDSGKEANIFIRLYENWPRGFYAFVHSPIVGIGFGAMNDLPFHFSTSSSLFAWNAPENYIFDSNHAHHSYLHILGEQGVVGFYIFMMFWYNLYKSISNSSSTMFVKLYLLSSMVAILIAGFTEHRLTTPSSILPFTISIALWQIKMRSEANNVKN